MAKSTHLNLELTDDNPFFDVWCEQINGVGEGENKSNAQLIDEFAGKFAGGTVGKVFVKKTSTNFDGEWLDIDNGASLIVSTDGDVTATIKPDKFYNFVGILTSLTITLGETITGRENEYKGQFVTTANVPTVSFPNDIVWVGDFPTIEANKTYQFSILNNIGVMVGV